jgi:hypothetical protein
LNRGLWGEGLEYESFPKLLNSISISKESMEKQNEKNCWEMRVTEKIYAPHLAESSPTKKCI